MTACDWVGDSLDCWDIMDMDRLDGVEAKVDGVLTCRTRNGSKAPTGVALCVLTNCDDGTDEEVDDELFRRCCVA